MHTRPGLLQMVLLLLCTAGMTGLTACCPCPKREDTGLLPPPLTLSEQLYAYNARARLINMVAARGSVKITWLDKGKSRTDSADASLRIQQRYGEDAPKNHGGDLIIFGRVAGQEVFQVGKNPEDTWYLFRMDTKTAWTAKTAVLASSNLVGPFRADLLLDLLGITELPELANPRVQPYEYVVQRYPAKPEQVELLVFRMVLPEPYTLLTNNSIAPPQPPVITYALQCCITLDRRTGLPQSVTVYDPNGLALVVASLSDYRDAPLRDGDRFRADAVPPKLPYHIEVSYPRTESSVILSLEEASIPAKLPPTVFTTPKFADEGLKVLPIEPAK